MRLKSSGRVISSLFSLLALPWYFCLAQTTQAHRPAYLGFQCDLRSHLSRRCWCLSNYTIFHSTLPGDLEPPLYERRQHPSLLSAHLPSSTRLELWPTASPAPVLTAPVSFIQPATPLYPPYQLPGVLASEAELCQFSCERFNQFTWQWSLVTNRAGRVYLRGRLYNSCVTFFCEDQRDNGCVGVLSPRTPNGRVSWRTRHLPCCHGWNCQLRYDPLNVAGGGRSSLIWSVVARDVDGTALLVAPQVSIVLLNWTPAYLALWIQG